MKLENYVKQYERNAYNIAVKLMPNDSSREISPSIEIYVILNTTSKVLPVRVFSSLNFAKIKREHSDVIWMIKYCKCR